MNESFLLNFTPQETRVALLQNGVVQELHIERTSIHGLVISIYNGRVLRVLPGWQSGAGGVVRLARQWVCGGLGLAGAPQPVWRR